MTDDLSNWNYFNAGWDFRDGQLSETRRRTGLSWRPKFWLTAISEDGLMAQILEIKRYRARREHRAYFEIFLFIA